MTEPRYLTLRVKDDVTDEIIDAAYEIADGWYQNTRIDWDDLMDRLDGSTLADGSVIDLGDSMVSQAILYIKLRVGLRRRQS